MPRQVMPKQDPVERGRNFNEVALGFTAEQAQAEAAAFTAPSVFACRAVRSRWISPISFS